LEESSPLGIDGEEKEGEEESEVEEESGGEDKEGCEESSALGLPGGEPFLRSSTSMQPVILEERDVPFVEEKPPNLSPYFHVRIHRVRRPEPPREVK